MDTNDRKKKILFLITKSNWGGAQKYVYDLATRLSSEQYDVVVALGGDGPLKTKLETANIRVITIPNLIRDISLKKELLASRAIAHIVRAEQPDVLHVNSSKAGAVGACIGRLQRVPRVIFTAHGWAFNEDRGLLSRTLIKIVHWLTVLLAHQTITVSNALRAQMNWPFTRQKMTTVYLGQAQTEYLTTAQARSALVQTCPAVANKTDDQWLLSIGELHPVKQHTVAINAVHTLHKSFPNLRYLIIGEGELRPQLEAQIKKLQLENTVFLLGQVDTAAQYLAAADVFVFPSRSEAFGYVALEAAQAGVATVASAVGGIPEIVVDGKTGTLVPSNDPAALAKAIATYLHNPATRSEHAHAAQERAQDFSIENMLVQTETVYANR